MPIPPTHKPTLLRDRLKIRDAARQILRAHALIRPWPDLRDTKPYLASSNKPACSCNGTAALRFLLPLRLISPFILETSIQPLRDTSRALMRQPVERLRIPKLP
jgi:hypothetical protein